MELQRQEETMDPGSTSVGYILPKADICWGSLVGAGVDSGYLVMIDVSLGRRCPDQGPRMYTTL